MKCFTASLNSQCPKESNLMLPLKGGMTQKRNIMRADFENKLTEEDLSSTLSQTFYFLKWLQKATHSCVV